MYVYFSHGEIREEGGHGLTPPSPDSILGEVDPSTCEPPDFCDMTMYLHTRVSLVDVRTTQWGLKAVHYQMKFLLQSYGTAVPFVFH